MIFGRPMWEIMREDEQHHGHTPVLPGSVAWFPLADWDETCVVSRDGNEVRIIAIVARNPGTGAFRRLVDGIQQAGLRPVVSTPFAQMKAILIHWGWHRRKVGHDFETREEQWRPPRRAKLNSVALQRIIDEVRNGDGVPTGYNRVYHRHNR